MTGREDPTASQVDLPSGSQSDPLDLSSGPAPPAGRVEPLGVPQRPPRPLWLISFGYLPRGGEFSASSAFRLVHNDDAVLQHNLRPQHVPVTLERVAVDDR